MLGRNPKVKDFSRSPSAKLAVPPRPVRLIEGSCASFACPIEVVDRQHAEFGRDDVGPAREQLRGQAGGHRRNLHPVLEAAGGTLSSPAGTPSRVASAFSATSRKRAQLQQVLGQPVVLRALAQHLGGGHQAVVAHRLEDAQDLLVLRQRALLLVDLLVELEDLEVGGRDTRTPA